MSDKVIVYVIFTRGDGLNKVVQERSGDLNPTFSTSMVFVLTSRL